MSPTTNSLQGRSRRLLPLVVLLCGAIAYANSFQGVFVLDDSGTVESNVRIRHIWPQGIDEWTAWRVVADLTFGVNYRTGQLHPADYHATNLLIHLLAALVLYGVVRRTLRRPSMDGGVRQRGDLLAFWTAALWVVHPITTAAVTYVSQRYESLMSLFLLLVLYSTVRAQDSTRPALWYLAAVVCGVLGTMCKEIMIVVPVLVLVYDRTYLAGTFRDALRKRWPLYVGLGAIWGYFGVMTLWHGARTGISGTMTSTVSPWRYALTQSEVVAHYLRLIVQPSAMTLDYGWRLADSVSEVMPGALVSLLLVLLCATALLFRSRFGFLLFAFLCLLSPTSSFIPRPDPAFDHRMYLASACVVCAAVVGLHWVWTGVRERRTARGRLELWGARALCLVPLGALLGLTVQTWQRNAQYHSVNEIWKDVTRKRPDNIRAYQNLSAEAFLQGSYEVARAYCGEVVKRVPAFGEMTNTDFDAVLRADSYRVAHWVYAWSNAKNTEGLIHREQGDLLSAISCFREAVRLTPGNRIAQSNLARAEAEFHDRTGGDGQPVRQREGGT